MSAQVWKPGDPVTEDSCVPAAVFRDFYQNHWPRDWYHDDSPIEVEDWDGNWILPDDAIVPLSDLGYCVWQGKEGQPHRIGEMFPVVKIFREWAEGAAPEAVVVIAAPNESLDAILRAVEAHGGRIVGNGALMGKTSEDPSPRP